MAGRGYPQEAEDLTTHPRVWRWWDNDGGIWSVRPEPIQYDRTWVGTGPGLAFGKALAEAHPDWVICLVPSAEGSTMLSEWQKGGWCYERAKGRLARAMAATSGTLAGIIWHQGEGDACYPSLAASYGQRLTATIENWRADLGTPDLPFVAGELGRFLSPSVFPAMKTVNRELASITLPKFGLASSTGLADDGGQIHFDCGSQRQLGSRYAAAWSRLTTTAAATTNWDRYE
jgi:hypothetical protein